MKNINRESLDKLYNHFNKTKYISPDPLQFLEKFETPEDMEIGGLIAGGFAYGRVAAIIKNLESIFSITSFNIKDFILSHSDKDIHKLFIDFKYRFTTSQELVSLLMGMRTLIKNNGSLKNSLLQHLSSNDKTIHKAMGLFVSDLLQGGSSIKNSLLPDPRGTSAVKRLNLYLRWMIRKDNVDPGPWSDIDPSLLIIPLDTHMYHFARSYGFTEKKGAGIKTALEITDKFKEINPEDPVKYDFALTRFGIKAELSWEDFDEMIKKV